MFEDIKQKTNNVEQDAYDNYMFDNLMKSSSALQEITANPPMGAEPFREMVKDIWAGYYKTSPRLTEEKQVSPLYKGNRPFVERFLEDSETEKARVSTMLDDLAAGLATMTTAQVFGEEIKNRPELQEAMKNIEQAKKFYDSGEGDPHGDNAMTEAMKSLSENATDVRRAVRKAVEAGEKKVDDMEQVLAGWGLGTGDLKTVPMDERLALVEKLTGNPDLKKISDLVGRMRNLARAKQKDKVAKNRDEIHSITLGNDLSHVLPQELAKLKHPVLKKDFYRKFNQKSLLQYDLKSNEKKGRGPIICLVDISGSMWGQPLQWAISVALALVDTAARQKRRSKIVFFDTEVQKVVEFEPGEKDINKFVDVATTGADGGTDYTPALVEALETIKNQKYQNADVLMITDGLCRVDDSFLDEYNKARKEFKSYCVLIGSDRAGQLKKWNDQTWCVPSLDDETAGEVFEEIY